MDWSGCSREHAPRQGTVCGCRLSVRLHRVLALRTRSEATSSCVRPLLRIVGPVSVHQLFGPIHSRNGHAVDLAKCFGPAPTCCHVHVDRGVRVDCALWFQVRSCRSRAPVNQYETGEPCSGDLVSSGLPVEMSVSRCTRSGQFTLVLIFRRERCIGGNSQESSVLVAKLCRCGWGVPSATKG